MAQETSIPDKAPANFQYNFFMFHLPKRSCDRPFDHKPAPLFVLRSAGEVPTAQEGSTLPC